MNIFHSQDYSIKWFTKYFCMLRSCMIFLVINWRREQSMMNYQSILYENIVKPSRQRKMSLTSNPYWAKR